jgi:hypothetical protein
MLIKENTGLGVNTRVVRGDDHSIALNKLKSFDTETKEAVMYVSLSSLNKDACKVAVKRDKHSTENNLSISDKGYGAEVVTAEVTLHGYIAIDKRTGKEIG